MTNEEILNQQLSEMRLIEFHKGNLDSVDDTSRDDIFQLMLKRAKYIALGTLYPFDLEISELPQNYFASISEICVRAKEYGN